MHLLIPLIEDREQLRATAIQEQKRLMAIRIDNKDVALWQLSDNVACFVVRNGIHAVKGRQGIGKGPDATTKQVASG